MAWKVGVVLQRLNNLFLHPIRKFNISIPGTSERVQVSVITLTTSGGKGASPYQISFLEGVRPLAVLLLSGWLRAIASWFSCCFQVCQGRSHIRLSSLRAIAHCFLCCFQVCFGDRRLDFLTSRAIACQFSLRCSHQHKK